MEETTIVTLIAGLITAATTFGGVLLNNLYNFKKYKMYNNLKFIELNKELNKDNEEIKTKISEIDKNQNEKISIIEANIKSFNNEKILNKLQDIEKDITYLKDLHKYTYLFKELENKITKTADNILILSEFKNKEIKEALKLGQKKGFQIFELILNRDFQIENKSLQEEILLALKSVKLSIDCRKLCLKDSDNFLLELEAKLRVITNNFIIEFQDVSKKNNGERRKMFELLAIQLIKNIYVETITLYKSYE